MWALKYRPTKLSQVIGQNWAKRTISGALSRPEVPQAWMLYGPYGVGKTTFTHIIAKTLICPNRDGQGNSCDSCDSCKQMDAKVNPNYVDLDAASCGGVDEIKALIEEAKLAPTMGSATRVIALDEAHMLTKNAQNALLETLEDGIGQTVFLLVTTDPHKLLPTVQSRCIQVKLDPVDKTSLVELLTRVTTEEKVEAEPQALQLIAEIKQGHVRDTLTLAEQVSLVGPITREAVKQHLNLDMDEVATALFLKFYNNSAEGVTFILNEIKEVLPHALWDATKRAFIEAIMNVESTGVIEASPHTIHLTQKLASRFPKIADWILSGANSLQVKTTADLIVAYAVLRDKLGVDKMQNASQRKGVGTPKARQKLKDQFDEQDILEDFTKGIFG